MKGPNMRIIVCVILLTITIGLTAFTAEGLPSPESYVTYVPGEGIAADDLDLTIKPSTVFVFQGTPNPNREPGSGDFGASWVTYIPFEKKFNDTGRAYLLLKTGWGDTVERDLDLFSNVNYNAYDVKGNIRARKFWYEQYLFDEQLTISCGKYNARDEVCQNKYARDDDVQFIGWLFNKFPAIEWPADYTFTIHAGIRPSFMKFAEFEFNFFEADADWKKIFHRGTYMGQVNFKPSVLLGADPKEWDSNYRFYGFLDSRKHIKLTRPDEGASGETKEVNYGFGLSFDQMVTHTYGVFGRVGWRRPDIAPATGGATIEIAWLFGGQMTGEYWSRPEDVFSAGVGQVVPSTEYKDSGGGGRAEGHIEAYYRYQFNKIFSVSPNFQMIWNPAGMSNSDNGPIFVYGLRVRWVI